MERTAAERLLAAEVDYRQAQQTGDAVRYRRAVEEMREAERVALALSSRVSQRGETR